MAKKKKLKLASERTFDEKVQVLLTRYEKVRVSRVPEKMIVPEVYNRVFRSFGEYNEMMAPVVEAKRWNMSVDDKNIQKSRLLSKIKKELAETLPPYNWFVYTVWCRDLAVGVSTTDWGGYSKIVHIEEYSEYSLKRLGHD